jgi:hypothetical protein
MNIQLWQETTDTWLKLWWRAARELERNADSTRAQLVERTCYRRLEALMAQKRAAQGETR